MERSFPEPDADETDDHYRKRLREWFDSIPDDPDGGPEFSRHEWEYICALVGVSPD